MADKKKVKILLLSALAVFTFFFRVSFVIADMQSPHYIIEGEGAGFVNTKNTNSSADQTKDNNAALKNASPEKAPAGLINASMDFDNQVNNDPLAALFKIIIFATILVILSIIYLLILIKKKNAPIGKK